MHPVRTVAFLLVSVSSVQGHDGNDSFFCEMVKVNHGCCPACGYRWDEFKRRCVSQEPPRTAYCKSLVEPGQSGCCAYCKQAWSASDHMCVAAEDNVRAADGAVPHNFMGQDYAALARSMVSTLTWGVLSTISTRSEGTNVSCLLYTSPSPRDS